MTLSPSNIIFSIMLVLGFSQYSNQEAQALPIGFGTNGSELEYSEIITDNFYVYFDRDVENEGKSMVNTLEKAHTIIPNWIGKSRESGQIVVSSAVTYNPSFANFITDAIELQTGGEGDRDLFLHEYTHSIMYQHFQNFLGPAGALIYLPWLPAWWIEGLAEVFSISVGSAYALGIERNLALSGKWPSYDSMHSLYNTSESFERYSQAGNFVRFILKKAGANNLPAILKDLRDYSEPWWWPATIIPFTDLLPIERVIEKYTGHLPEELYELYKKQATDYWKNNQSTTMYALEADFQEMKNIRYFNPKFANGELKTASLTKGERKFVQINFDKSGWAADKNGQKYLLPGNIRLNREINSEGIVVHTTRDIKFKNGRSSYKLNFSLANKTEKSFYLDDTGFIPYMTTNNNRIFWISDKKSKRELCSLDIPAIKEHINSSKSRSLEPICHFSATYPESFEVLSSDDESKTLYLSIRKQTLSNDVYQILKFSSSSLKGSQAFKPQFNKPYGLIKSGEHLWLLSSERSQFTVRKLSREGDCLGVFPLGDIVNRMYAVEDAEFALKFKIGSRSAIKRFGKPKGAPLTLQSCYEANGHVNPVMAAFAKQPQQIDFENALAATKFYQPGTDKMENLDAEFWGNPNDAAKRPLLSEIDTPKNLSNKKSIVSPAGDRYRPVFMFPWIGADDAYGTQLGIVSIPLMDHRQNETVRLTALYGMASLFPSTELQIVSSRYWPFLSFSVFRKQTYNGNYFDSSVRRTKVLYYDEKGVMTSVETPFYFYRSKLTLGVSLKNSHLTPYIGPTYIRQGRLNELGATINYLRRFYRSSFSIFFRSSVAPEAINSEFDYNDLGGGTNYSYLMPFAGLSLSFGLEGSRTRGKKMKHLREIYRPLKTFIPGSGGGYNKNSFPIYGSGYLFDSENGDTQARAKINATMPLIRDFDTHFWILYIERLDFTAFFNYGDAWFQSYREETLEMIAAHGYNLDLQFENKGVRFNVGTGVGQVFGKDYDVYLTTGFDAIF